MATDAFSQNSAEDIRKRASERLGGGGMVALVVAPRNQQPVISYVTYISEEREWTNLAGTRMTGRLVAISAPNPGQQGPIVVIQDGKVKLRRTGAKEAGLVDLASLSEPDQNFIKSVEMAILKRNAAPAATTATSSAPKP